jgi:YgiT-type zinc finger domain-containing protein
LKEDTCENCGGEIKPNFILKEHWYDGESVQVSDVPVGICKDCGERYYEAATLEQLDTIVMSLSSKGRLREVPQVSYAQFFSQVSKE